MADTTEKNAKDVAMVAIQELPRYKGQDGAVVFGQASQRGTVRAYAFIKAARESGVSLGFHADDLTGMLHAMRVQFACDAAICDGFNAVDAQFE